MYMLDSINARVSKKKFKRNGDACVVAAIGSDTFEYDSTKSVD